MNQNSDSKYKISAIYSFDNINQFKQFLISAKSLYLIKENIEEVKLILFLTKELKIELEGKIHSLFKNIDPNISINIKEIDFETGVISSKGKFAWIYSPFKTNTDYIIQLDNDTIVNLRILNLFTKFESILDKCLFLGRADSNILENPQWGDPVKFALNIDNPYDHGNYINTGVVLFKRENAIREFESEKKLLTKISSLNKLLVKNKFQISESDQNILYILWGDKFNATLPRIYNWSPKIILNKKEAKIFNKGNIVHYNIWSFNSLYKINRKLDIDKWLEMDAIDSYDYFVSLYLLQVNKSNVDLLSKNEISILKRVFKNLNNTIGEFRYFSNYCNNIWLKEVNKNSNKKNTKEASKHTF